MKDRMAKLNESYRIGCRQPKGLEGGGLVNGVRMRQILVHRYHRESPGSSPIDRADHLKMKEQCFGNVDQPLLVPHSRRSHVCKSTNCQPPEIFHTRGQRSPD